jgi:hypothetical protein
MRAEKKIISSNAAYLFTIITHNIVTSYLFLHKLGIWWPLLFQKFSETHSNTYIVSLSLCSSYDSSRCYISSL